MPKTVDKVTAFITRPSQRGTELLLFEHPNAGNQIPAGTVEAGETPEQAVVREATEETGLTSLSVRQYLGCVEEKLPGGKRLVAKPTKVYARPDLTSFDWAWLRRGIPVTLDRQAASFSQITYREWDQEPDPQYVTLGITGWVPDDTLANAFRRHFFHLSFQGDSAKRWTVFSDNHVFTLFWAPLTALPEIIPPQKRWLEFLRRVDLFIKEQPNRCSV